MRVARTADGGPLRSVRDTHNRVRFSRKDGGIQARLDAQQWNLGEIAALRERREPLPVLIRQRIAKPEIRLQKRVPLGLLLDLQLRGVSRPAMQKKLPQCLQLPRRTLPPSPEIVSFQLRVNSDGETLHALVGVIEKRSRRAKWVLRRAARKAGKDRLDLSILYFVGTVQAHLPKIILIGGDPVFQMRGEARFNVVQHCGGHNELFIKEALVKEFVDFLEFRDGRSHGSQPSTFH